MEKGKKNNDQLKGSIEDTISRYGYSYVDKKKFELAKHLKQPIYTKNIPIGKGIYNTELHAHFMIYHPKLHPKGLIIDAKWQEGKGTTDEKFPYFVLNIREKYPLSTIIVLDGGGYREGAEQWIRKQVNKKLIHIFNLTEFHKWSKSNNL